MNLQLNGMNNITVLGYLDLANVLSLFPPEKADYHIQRL